MKTNWQTKKLNEVCNFYNGLWKGKKPPYRKIGVIRNTNFTKNGRLDGSDIAVLDVEEKQFEKRNPCHKIWLYGSMRQRPNCLHYA